MNVQTHVKKRGRDKTKDRNTGNDLTIPKSTDRTFNISIDEREITTRSGLLMFPVAVKRFVYINSVCKQPHIFSYDQLKNKVLIFHL